LHLNDEDANPTLTSFDGTLVATRRWRYNFRNHGVIAMTQLKVRPIGNSLGVVLPKEILARLNLKSGDHLHLTEAPDGAMRITAYDPGFEEQMRLARKGMRKFRNALRELAK
jgi:putative addiction module antidote